MDAALLFSGERLSEALSESSYLVPFGRDHDDRIISCRKALPPILDFSSQRRGNRDLTGDVQAILFKGDVHVSRTA
jgi:hypothetical protein